MYEIIEYGEKMRVKPALEDRTDGVNIIMSVIAVLFYLLDAQDSVLHDLQRLPRRSQDPQS